MNNSCIVISDSDDEETDLPSLDSSELDDEDVHLQNAIAESFQGFSKEACIQDGQGAEKSFQGCKELPAQDVFKTSKRWPAEPIVLSSGESEMEDSDSLPDLEDFTSQSTKAHCVIPPHSTSTNCDELRTERHFIEPFCSTSDTVTEKGDNLVPGMKLRKDNAVKHSTEVPKSDSGKMKRDRISLEMQAGSSPVPGSTQHYEIFSFPPDLARKKSCEIEKQVVMRHKYMRVKFLHDLTTFFPIEAGALCRSFEKLQASCLDDLSDDVRDPNAFSNFMDLLEDFSSSRKPPEFMLEKIIDIGFCNPVKEMVSTRIFSVVLKIWQLYPDVIIIDLPSVLVAGDVIQKFLRNPKQPENTDSVAKASVHSSKGCPKFHQAWLYFQLFVRGLQIDLSRCRLADQKSVFKTLAFKFLSLDVSQTLKKQLTHWLDICLLVRQPQQLGEAKQWMYALQTLLEVSVMISGDRLQAAKKLSPELNRTYKYLADINIKKQFLESFTCPLLCFCVVRLVMEEQCKSTIVSSQFPASMHEVIHNYFLSLPPHNHLTPPSSPDNEYGCFQRYSVQSCEELAMLIYFISRSFITCKQRRLDGDLRQQVLKGFNVPVLTEEQRREFEHSVEDFGAHLRSLSQELNVATISYLTLLKCMCLSS